MSLRTAHPNLQLLDYRRTVFALYAETREIWEENPLFAHRHWRQRRDALFGTHPQSALAPEQRAGFEGLRYYPYNPDLVYTASLLHVEEEEPVQLSGAQGDPFAFHRFGAVELPIGRLNVYWLDSYGGGIFLPFCDGTTGDTTYGGGRYLLDTVKGADLGSGPPGTLIIDFNFAYHPSCHYNPMWACPLAPSANWLEARVEAGEQNYPDPRDPAPPPARED